jgi:prolyl 4-hydroxylase
VSALARLPPDWQGWVRLNVSRGCSRESMLVMLEGGGFAADLASDAIAEAVLQPLAAVAVTSPAPPPPFTRPVPYADGNVLVCHGQAVRVVMALDTPQLVVYENLLSDAECTLLVELAEGRMAPSTVVDDEGGHARPDSHRTSTGASFQRGEFALLALIEERIAELLAWPVANGEGLQVLRYTEGGEYSAHLDYFDPDKAGSAAHLAQGGQRLGTLLLYLCDVPAGGGTRFPTLGLELRPQRGSGVYFANVDGHGRVDPASLHAGVAVREGVKYIATKWLRQRVYAAPPA